MCAAVLDRVSRTKGLGRARRVGLLAVVVFAIGLTLSIRFTTNQYPPRNRYHVLISAEAWRWSFPLSTPIQGRDGIVRTPNEEQHRRSRKVLFGRTMAGPSRRRASSSGNLLDLPEVLLEGICSYLTIRDITSLASTASAAASLHYMSITRQVAVQRYEVHYPARFI